jgi:hypothetical protein
MLVEKKLFDSMLVEKKTFGFHVGCKKKFKDPSCWLKKKFQVSFILVEKKISSILHVG